MINMTINWTQFTPVSALIGGMIIGLAAVSLLFFNGRIAGISGIMGGLLSNSFSPHQYWRVAFVLGLVVTPVLYGQVHALPSISITHNTLLLVIAGLLVGVGTRYGSGCTSGHGVCGISRLSPRSLVATLSFMLVGFVTVFIIRTLGGF